MFVYVMMLGFVVVWLFDWFAVGGRFAVYFVCCVMWVELICAG